ALRLNQIGDLLKRHRDALEPDPHGEPVVRHEILAWSPGAAGLAAARSAGLTVVGEGGDDGVTVLRVPDGADTAGTLERLRAADPDGVYDFNHIYTGSASGPEDPAPAGRSGSKNAAPNAKPGATRVGLVDGGVAREHEVFRDAAIVAWGCDGAGHPNPHGTAVAALMIGRSPRFQGVAPDATLYAADIYCDSPTGGSASRIAGALGWLARERVAVVNISLVGPPNQILEQVVKRMVRRGHLLVAAVGNDGPAAPPLYPASYPGVVGVSGVDAKGRPLPEAARGPQVMFAAPGNQMVSAAVGAPPYRTVRGTSFASPIVAALLAGALERPDPDAARQAIATVAKGASGVAAGTVSNETGYGVLGAAFRVDPSAFR
ncbi:MAG TPA: S8 family serine peptidase, partial [Duganella sp.]|uniref:S8 family serine peptidase n=1 Tax=Duganella sp. TaxID=1904440 RepID=UPI002ED507FE